MSMRNQIDPREKEMMEKCNIEDEEKQKSHLKIMDEIKEKKSWDRLKPFIRPKYALYLGVLFLGISQEKEIVGGLAFGSLLGL